MATWGSENTGTTSSASAETTIRDVDMSGGAVMAHIQIDCQNDNGTPTDNCTIRVKTTTEGTITNVTDVHPMVFEVDATAADAEIMFIIGPGVYKARITGQSTGTDAYTYAWSERLLTL